MISVTFQNCFQNYWGGGLEHYLPPLPTGLIGVHDKLNISFGMTKGFDLPRPTEDKLVS